VITGGGGGIGGALARAFAARGARLALADVDVDAAEAVAAELRDAGHAAEAFAVDVTDRDDVFRLAEAVVDRFGGVHVICNNAGIAIVGEMHSAPHADWLYTMDVNFWGVVHGVQAFVPRILAGGEGGYVLNTASMAGLVGMSWLGIYAASKFAVVGLTESLARELRDREVGVSVLCPMIVETDINARSMQRHPDPARRGETIPGAPAGAMKGGVISPEQVARRVVAAMDRRQLYIPTHPEQREILRRRAARIDAVFEPERWEL